MLRFVNGMGAWALLVALLSAASSAAGVDCADTGSPSEPEEPSNILTDAALPIHGVWGGQVLSEAKLYGRLERSPAICFGEAHDSAYDHYAQLRAFQALTRHARHARHARRPFAVGFEAFQVQFQPALSGYIGGTLSEAELITQSEYAQRWGFDFALYRPLLERARALHLPALALNARTELTRKIGRTGLASLTAAEQAQLPELNLTDPEHVAYIYGLFGVLPGHEEESGLANFYAAQVTWDETMADTAAAWLEQAGTGQGKHGAQVLLFAGSVHCHRSAIPHRITRRTGEPALAVLPILASELAAFPELADGYDVLVVLEDEVLEESALENSALEESALEEL